MKCLGTINAIVEIIFHVLNQPRILYLAPWNSIVARLAYSELGGHTALGRLFLGPSAVTLLAASKISKSCRCQ